MIAGWIYREAERANRRGEDTSNLWWETFPKIQRILLDNERFLEQFLVEQSSDERSDAPLLDMEWQGTDDRSDEDEEIFDDVFSVFSGKDSGKSAVGKNSGTYAMPTLAQINETLTLKAYAVRPTRRPRRRPSVTKNLASTRSIAKALRYLAHHYYVWAGDVLEYMTFENQGSNQKNVALPP